MEETDTQVDVVEDLTNEVAVADSPTVAEVVKALPEVVALELEPQPLPTHDSYLSIHSIVGIPSSQTSRIDAVPYLEFRSLYDTKKPVLYTFLFIMHSRLATPPLLTRETKVQQIS